MPSRESCHDRQSRKECLKKLAQGSIYAAPVVSTLLAPRSVNAQGQGQESQAMEMQMQMAQQRNLPDAPWCKPLPGR
jgi:hypothetical protein